MMADGVEQTNETTGDTAVVTVDGIPYETHLDDRGVRRFLPKPDHWLVKQIPKTFDKYLQREIDDMVEMNARFRRGDFSLRDYMEMNMAVGYSISGFADLFPNVEIVNQFEGRQTASDLDPKVEEPVAVGEKRLRLTGGCGILESVTAMAVFDGWVIAHYRPKPDERPRVYTLAAWLKMELSDV